MKKKIDEGYVFLLPFPKTNADFNNTSRLGLEHEYVNGNNPYNNRKWRGDFWNSVVGFYQESSFRSNVVQWGKFSSTTNEWDNFRKIIALIQIDVLTFMIMDLTNILNDSKRLHHVQKDFKKYVKRYSRTTLKNLQDNIETAQNNLKSTNSQNPTGGSRKKYKAKKRKTVNARRRRITRKM